ncbi:MAG: hypothetical protein HY326_08850 [Chloroflexi bacterium]|nr:hypothetical protein [Chloroflexota bacterium]
MQGFQDKLTLSVFLWLGLGLAAFAVWAPGWPGRLIVAPIPPLLFYALWQAYLYLRAGLRWSAMEGLARLAYALTFVLAAALWLTDSLEILGFWGSLIAFALIALLYWIVAEFLVVRLVDPHVRIERRKRNLVWSRLNTLSFLEVLFLRPPKLTNSRQ